VSDRLRTADGITLEAEWAVPDDPRAVAVLCHPHPAYGGTMRSIVTSALFEHLPARRVACLRFNFRGVEHSAGASTEGRDEPQDVQAAVEAASAAVPGRPLVVAGWSFGADMALTAADARISGWALIAPPLRFRPPADYEPVARDARPKVVVLAEHDEFRPPAQVRAFIRDWASTRVEEVAGASHFFVGRTERVVALVDDFVQGCDA
jgi:alpha/beta superfamily hydrolase